MAGTLEPEVKEPPQVAAVGTDGGRMFTRAPDAGRGVHEGAWKETKIACLTTLSSETYQADPHPELPGCFSDQDRVGKLVREVKSLRNEAGDSSAASSGAGQATGGEDVNLLESLVLSAESTEDGAGEAVRL